MWWWQEAGQGVFFSAGTRVPDLALTMLLGDIGRSTEPYVRLCIVEDAMLVCIWHLLYSLVSCKAYSSLPSRNVSMSCYSALVTRSAQAHVPRFSVTRTYCPKTSIFS